MSYIEIEMVIRHIRSDGTTQIRRRETFPSDDNPRFRRYNAEKATERFNEVVLPEMLPAFGEMARPGETQ